MWFKVDDGLAFHRKAVEAGNAAIGLWVRAGAHCGQHLTDGFIPTKTVLKLGTRAQAARLVAVGLWVEVDGGYQFHGWGEWQPTRDEVVSGRKHEASRKKIWRDSKKIEADFPETPRSEAPVPRQMSPTGTRDTGSGRGSSNGSGLTSTSDYKRQPDVTSQGLQVWKDHLAQCGHTPPRDVSQRTSDAIERLLADGISEPVIRSALKLMRERPRTGPGLLPDLVYEVQRAATGGAPSTRHVRAQAAVDAGRRVQAMINNNGQRELE